MLKNNRMDMTGSIHHVAARALEKNSIFLTDQDRSNFTSRIEDITSSTRASIYAWSLSHDQIHLLVKTGFKSLSFFMKSLLSGYAVSFNREHDRSGQVFQGRYSSSLIEEKTFFLPLINFVHLVPVQSGELESVDELDNYPWSGHPAILGTSEIPWQDSSYVLQKIDKDTDTARKSYRESIESEFSSRKFIKNQLDLNTSILGSEAFKKEIDKQFKPEMKRKREEELRKSKAFKLMIFDDIITETALANGISLKILFGRGRQKPVSDTRSIICHYGVYRLGITCQDVGNILGVSAPAACIAARRGEKIIKTSTSLASKLDSFLIDE